MHYTNRNKGNHVGVSGRRVGRHLGKRRPCDIERLETRTLLNATIKTTMPNVHAPTNAIPTGIDLNTYFADSNVTGTLVMMHTTEGDIPINLYDSQVGTTVSNFLNYVDSGEYNNTVFHRVIQSGIQILQGGTYTTNLDSIPVGNPIPLQATIQDTAGTIAMARTSQPNSATSGFFFNVADNSNQFTGTNQYAVFGQVIYNGMDAVNRIYNLQETTVTTNDGLQQTNFPVANYTGGTPTVSNYAVIQSAAVLPPLTYGVSTDNNQLVTPTLSPDGSLTLTYTPGATGTAHIIVNATDLINNTVSQTFTVTVGGLPTTTATAGRGQARIIRFTDPNGVAGTATLVGPGTATLTFTGDSITTATSKAGVETVTGTPQSISIATTGTTAGSALNISGGVSLAGITTDASIGSIRGLAASLSGDLSVGGTIGMINFSDLGSGTVSVSGTGRSLFLRVASATGESVNSSQTIASINAGTWTGGAMSAPAITRIAVTDKLNAQITTPTLGLVTAGSITTSAWNVSGKVAGISAGSISGLHLNAGTIGPITDRGTAQDDVIISGGNIGAVRALSMSNTQIEAAPGASDSNGLATSFAANSSIASVVVGSGGFSDSLIEGQTLRRVSLGTLSSSSNNHVPFGVVSSDIALLTATIDGKRFILSRATTAAAVSAALSKAGITPTDLEIRIV